MKLHQTKCVPIKFTPCSKLLFKMYNSSGNPVDSTLSEKIKCCTFDPLHNVLLDCGPLNLNLHLDTKGKGNQKQYIPQCLPYRMCPDLHLSLIHI